MRLLAILCLYLAGLSGQQSSAPHPPTPTAGVSRTPAPAQLSEGQRNQQKARAVIDQMIAALGGQAYLNVQDAYSEGRYGRFHNETMAGGAKYFRYWKWPDSERWELTDQRDIVQLYVDDKAMEVTFRGSRQLFPEKDEGARLMLQRRHYALEIILRNWLNEPGTALFDEGSALTENRMAESITIINSKNDAVTILVSVDTHLPVKKTFFTRDPQSHERDEEDEIFDNWKKEQGINTPHRIVIMRNGQMARQQFISNVTYNNHPPDSYFTPILINHEKK